MYPRPPYHYKDAKVFLSLFYPPEGTLEKILPPSLRPSQMPLGAVMIGEMPCIETGTFNEAAVLLQCMFDNPTTKQEEVGVYFAYGYANTDVAITSGREIWGYPRKLADISMNWKKDRLEAQVVRDGVTLIKTGCTLNDEGAWIDSGPNINLKMIPNAGGKGYDIAVLNAAYLVYDIKNGRSGEVEIEFNNGPHDNFESISIESTMIGLYFDCDITVPEGNKIAKFKA
jgi:acetoacetate decarboxylase